MGLYSISHKLPNTLGRTGVITTDHGTIETPAFIPVATKATVKSLSPEQVKDLGAQAVLSNTYHLCLVPGEDVVSKAGGLHSFMNWDNPIMTDSGGFQVFSLGSAYGKGVSKFAKTGRADEKETPHSALADVTEEGVTFKSHLDGSTHTLTPERSIEIQHALGPDIIFAFDECTSPNDPEPYLRDAMERTHRWAKRSLVHHRAIPSPHGRQFLYGIVQGGNNKKLRKESARIIGSMEFDGYGIGGSFTKEDLDDALAWVNEILPEEKPRHLLGIGAPHDFFVGIENGCDTFDCVAPTRMARNGGLYTRTGTINITNSAFVNDFTPIDTTCECYTCRNYTRAYVAHLFRAKEMLAATLATIHNLHFSVTLVDEIRNAIEEGSYDEMKEEFLNHYK